MSKFWYSKSKIKCPYYVGERDQCIVCEGIIPDTSQQSKFEDPETKSQYKIKYCNGFNYSQCAIVKAKEK